MNRFQICERCTYCRNVRNVLYCENPKSATRSVYLPAIGIARAPGRPCGPEAALATGASITRTALELVKSETETSAEYGPWARTRS